MQFEVGPPSRTQQNQESPSLSSEKNTEDGVLESIKKEPKEKPNPQELKCNCGTQTLNGRG